MRVICEINWSHSTQWSFVVDDDQTVLTGYSIIGDAEPRRTFAWALSVPDNYQQFLKVLLGRYHMSKMATTNDVVRIIILIQNEFAKAILKELDA